jgi:hypothetical protein
MNRSALAFLLAMTVAIGCAEPPSSPASGGSCQGFGACGGDPAGVWSVFDVCYDEQVFREATRSAITAPECADWLVATEVSVTGRLSFGEDQLVSDLVLRQTLDTVWSQDCLDALSATPTPLSPATCDSLGLSLSMDSEGGAECEVVDGLCHCLADVVSTSHTETPYSVQGNQINSPMGRSDFCVDGDDLLFRGKADAVRPELVMILRRD